MVNHKKIWIDLDNSPHVPFFKPIIKELEKRGRRVTLTVRDCFQVCGLADLHGLEYLRIGRHYGKSKLLKLVGTIYRSFQLLRCLSISEAGIALSHGSRSQILASKLMRIPSVLIADYEHSKGLKVLHPDFLIVPEVVKNAESSRHSSVTFAYPGIKEDVYVPDFVPSAKCLEELGINTSDLIITIRPPATEAHYHNPEAEMLFAEAVDYFGSRNDVRMVILPRNEKKQGDMIRSRWGEWWNSKKIIIPEHVVDGLNLIWHSDLVISGGGTMNREAAALGVPVYSIFRGKIGAVDRYLSENGRLILIEKREDVRGKIEVIRREKAEKLENRSHATLDRIVDAIEEAMKMRK